MTPLQEKLFELLCVVDDVCRKHQIHYYLHAGTVLGAVRHGGFIPWDDDIDVIMTRDEWEKFHTAFCAEEEIQNHYVLEYYPKTGEGHVNTFALVKDRASTRLFMSLCAADIAKSCNIDIMIFDPAPGDDVLQRKQKKALLRYGELLGTHFVMNRESKYADYLWDRFCARLFGRKKVLEALEKKFTQYPDDDTCFGYMQSNVVFPGVWEKKYLQTPTYLNFEGRMFPCPTDTYHFLRYTYLDSWMFMPPKEMRRIHPSQTLTDVPYTIVEEDYKPYLNYAKVNHAWMAQKRSKLRAVAFEDIKRKTNYIKLAIAAGLALKNKLASAPVPLNTLFDSLRFAEAEELLEDYFSEQLGKQLSNDKIAVPIDEETLRLACLLLIFRGEYYHAQTIMDLHPDKAGRLPEVEELILLSRDLSIACFDDQDWERAWDLVQTALPRYPHHADFLAAQLWLSLRRGERSGEELIDLADSALLIHPGNESLLFCKAEALRALGQEKGAEELYRFLLQEAKNGLMCQYIKANVKGMQDTALELDIPISENEKLHQLSENVQTIILQLLTEVRDVCLQENIPFFLKGPLAVQAAVLEDFSPDCISAYVIMHPSHRRQFVAAMQRALRPDRSLECFETNPGYPEFTIRYGNTNTLKFNVNESGFYQHNNICLTVYFVRENEKNRYLKKFHDSITAAMEATAYPSVFHNLTKKKKLAGTIAKAMMLFLGRKRSKRILWNWVYHPKRAPMTIQGSIKGYWAKVEQLPQINFEERESVYLAGEEFYIPSDCHGYLSKRDQERLLNGKKIGGQPVFPWIVSTDISEREYFNMLRGRISERKYFRANRKLSNIYKKNQPYQAFAQRAWNIVRRSCSRFQLAQLYAPMKDRIVEAYREENYETLTLLLEDYIQELKVHITRGMVVVFDTEIFRITWALLEHQKEYDLIKRMIPKIPARHLEDLQFESDEVG